MLVDFTDEEYAEMQRKEAERKAQVAADPAAALDARIVKEKMSLAERQRSFWDVSALPQAELTVIKLAGQPNQAYYTDIYPDNMGRHIAHEGGICTVGGGKRAAVYLYDDADGLYHEDTALELDERIRARIRGFRLEPKESEVREVLATIRTSDFIEKRDVAQNALDDCWIPVANGLLNVKTRGVRSFTSARVYFTGVAIEYRENVAEDALRRLDAFIEHTIPDAAERRVFWQAVGYIFADFTVPMLFYIIGAPGSGKSQVLSLIRECIGAANGAGGTPQTLASRFGASGLIGKLCNIAEEGGGVLPDDYKLLLNIATGDAIRTEAKFQAEQYPRLHMPLFFASNDPPRMASGGGTAEALGDRLVIVHSGNPVRGTTMDVPNYGTVLASDPAIRTAFLHRALEGLDDLRKEKKFARTERMMETVAEVVTSGDAVRDFIEDTDWITVTDHEDCELKQDVYLVFAEWMKVKGLRVSKDIRYDDFNRGVHSLIRANVLQGVEDAQPRIAGERPRVWVGLKIVKSVAEAVKERDERERIPFCLI